MGFVCDDDVPPTGASNGGTPSALEDKLQYDDDEANESASDYLPPYSSLAPPPDNVHQEGGEMTLTLTQIGRAHV